MMLAFTFLAALAQAASAQDGAWKDLAVGDRVEVTFLSGATIRGTLALPSLRTAPVDYSRESALTLEVTWEYPGLNGTLTVPRKELRSLRKLAGLDPATLKDLAGMKKRLAEETAKSAPSKEPPPAPPVEVKPPAAPPEKTAPDAQEQKKALEFYAKFPPPSWGPVRHTLDVQKQARGQALSPAEREFEEGYPALWQKGQAAAQAPAPDPGSKD